MDQELFAVGSILHRPVDFGVHEVVDDADFVAHAEYLYGIAAHVFADAGDAVRLFDRELGDWEIGAVRADDA